MTSYLVGRHFWYFHNRFLLNAGSYHSLPCHRHEKLPENCIRRRDRHALLYSIVHRCYTTLKEWILGDHYFSLFCSSRQLACSNFDESWTDIASISVLWFSLCHPLCHSLWKPALRQQKILPFINGGKNIQKGSWFIVNYFTIHSSHFREFLKETTTTIHSLKSVFKCLLLVERAKKFTYSSQRFQKNGTAIKKLAEK